MSLNTVENQLFCVFKTDLPEEYRVPANKLDIQANFTQNELNQTLTQLLAALKKPSNKTFDFVIKGELLRGTIRSHLLKVGLATEKNVEVFYVDAFGSPKVGKTAKGQNWVNKLFYAESNIKRRLKSCKLLFR